MTAFHIAAACGHEDVLELLLEANMDPDIKEEVIMQHVRFYEFYPFTHYRINCFSVEVTFSLYMNETYHIPSSVGFSAPKLHTNALTANLYTFVTQTTPTH